MNSPTYTRASERARTPRIIQITGLTDPTTGAPILAALDTDGRIWIANAACPSAPGWEEMRPVPPDEPIKEPAKTAPVDPTELAGLLKELESILYHAAKDLHFLAAEIEIAVDRLGGEGRTDDALAAAERIRQASAACERARAAVAGEVRHGE